MSLAFKRFLRFISKFFFYNSEKKFRETSESYCNTGGRIFVSKRQEEVESPFLSKAYNSSLCAKEKELSKYRLLFRAGVSFKQFFFGLAWKLYAGWWLLSILLLTGFIGTAIYHADVRLDQAVLDIMSKAVAQNCTTSSQDRELLVKGIIPDCLVQLQPSWGQLLLRVVDHSKSQIKQYKSTTFAQIIYENNNQYGLTVFTTDKEARNTATIFGDYELLLMIGKSYRMESVYAQIISFGYSVLLVLVVITWLFIRGYTHFILRSIRRIEPVLDALVVADFDYLETEKIIKSNDELGVLLQAVFDVGKILKRKDQEKQQLLCNISHELRSPLTRMQLSLALARNKSTGLASAEHDRIERELDRLKGYIAQIIKWSQLVASVAYHKKSEIRLDLLISDIILDAQFEGRESNKKVKIIGSCEPCYVMGLEDWLRSAVENIVRNALRFTISGSTVEIQLIDNGHYIFIKVRDYGAGVAAEVLDHLFEPFFRADITQGGDFLGSGLGMTIAYSAVKWHGGRIIAENAEPGLVVTMTLPNV